MTEDDKLFLERIGAYADEVMADMDPNPVKTRISVQLDKLRPIMEEIATEQKNGYPFTGTTVFYFIFLILIFHKLLYCICKLLFRYFFRL